MRLTAKPAPIPRDAEATAQWSEYASPLEREILTAFAPVRADVYGTWTGGASAPQNTSAAAMYLSAPASLSAQAVERALELGRAGREVIIRVPAVTHTPYSFSLFEAHNALCFWQGAAWSASLGTMIAYLGQRPWDFSRALRAHGAVFVRGFGAAGPWASR